MLLGHPTRHTGTPIASLCDVMVVTQTSHQDCPCIGNPRKPPANFSRLVRKTKPGQGGDDNVEGFFRLAAMGRRVCQRTNDLQKLDDRSGPSMRQEDRQGILVLRSDVNEVDPEAINLRSKLRQPIQSALNSTPIVARAPVVSEGLRLGERYPLRPIRYGFLVRPPSVGKPLFEIVECPLRYVHGEGREVLRRRREHEQRGLLAALLGPYRLEPGRQQNRAPRYTRGACRTSPRGRGCR